MNTNTMNTQAKPTKTSVQMAKKFDPTELEARQAAGREAVLNGKYTYCKASGHGAWAYPAQDTFSFTGFELVIDFVIEMTKQGRELSTIDKPFHQGTFFQVSFLKDKETLQALYDESDALVAAEYEQEITDHNQAQQNLLVEQLVQAELNKDLKKEQQRLASIRAKAEKEAADFIRSQLEGAK